MIFKYTAIDSSGKTISGSIDSTDRKSVVIALRKQKLKPLAVKGSGARNFIPKFGNKVKTKELVIFTRQLSTMISAGVPLTRSLATLQSQTESKNFKKIVGEITKEIEGGTALADAFSHHPNAFSEVYINMIRAGETGGILDDILVRLATQVEKDSSMRKKIKSAMTYPVVILGITTVAFFGIMIFVIPKIGKILLDLGGPDAKLPVYTQAMLNISGFMQSNALLVIGACSLFIYFLKKYTRTPSGKYKLHTLLLKTPVIKGVITKVAIARFARTFASLMSSGVSVLVALEVTGGSIGNKVIEQELREAALEVKNGKQLSEMLAKSDHFPLIISQMLSIGEETGQIDTILLKVADFYEEEVETVINSLSSLIEPLMIIVLGAIVGVIAASVMGPIASLSKNIGT
jgi:type IV pilus assembly protein PilC